MNGNKHKSRGGQGFHKRVFLIRRVAGDEILFFIDQRRRRWWISGQGFFYDILQWTDDNELIIAYSAETDKATGRKLYQSRLLLT